MKKFTFFFFSLFLMLASLSAADYQNLYVVGNASNAGWDPDKALEMLSQGDGVFTWSGVLKDNREDQARFKFIVKRDWHPSITCRFDVNEHYVLTSGVEADLYERQNADVGFDNAFQVSESGIYSIHVNLSTMKITCTKTGEAEIYPDLNHLYLVGSATNSDGNWDKDNPLEMTKVSEGIFTWSGRLYVENGNEFKFLNERGSWSTTINPSDSDPEFVVDTDYNLNFRQNEGDPNDFKFKVTTAGEYTVNVDLNRMIARIEEGIVVIRPDLTQLYLVGSATNAEGNWDKDNPVVMTKIEEGVFAWSGNLYASNGGEFKFMNRTGVWSHTINPLSGDIGFIVNTDYELNFRPNESDPNDFKFLTTSSGIYSISVNLNTMSMRITSGGSTPISDRTVDGISFSIFLERGAIIIKSENDSCLGTINVFDVNGKKLNNENLFAGIYILKFIYNNNEFTQKVLVK